MNIVEEKFHGEYFVRLFTFDGNWNVKFYHLDNELESFVYDAGSTGEWQARNTFGLIDRTVQFMLIWAKEQKDNNRANFGCAT